MTPTATAPAWAASPAPTRRAVLALSLAAVAAPAAAQDAPQEAVFTNLWGHAIRGYDPVAYFTEGRPVEGSAAHTHEWRGATWRFASAENRDRFAADPEAFAPRYGGFCAWAVAQGYTASIDPEAWRIVDGALYLNYDHNVQARWEADIPGFIEAADANWVEGVR